MSGKQQRGFAAMSAEKQREIARAGGRAAHQSGNAHQFTPEEARQAGRKGGASVSQNRHHMAEIGRRGGQESQRRGTAHQWDPDEARAAGRQGGRANRQRPPELLEGMAESPPLQEQPHETNG